MERSWLRITIIIGAILIADAAKVIIYCHFFESTYLMIACKSFSSVLSVT